MVYILHIRGLNLISVKFLDRYKRFGVMKGPLFQDVRFAFMFKTLLRSVVSNCQSLHYKIREKSGFLNYILIKMLIRQKIDFSLSPAKKAHRESRGIALLFL